MKNNLIIITFLLFALCITANAQILEHVYSDSILKCVYHTMDGRIDGKYISYYKNGQKKAEGNFKNNYRDGKWTLWNSSGEMQITRDYKNPFSFDIIFQKKQSDTAITKYHLAYNKDGFIEYFPLQEKMVLMAKRVWRFIPVENNPLLFQNNYLQKIITANLENGNITAYSTNDDEFLTPLKPDEIEKEGINIIGYKIKEDWFFDNERMVSESRIIGICPVSLDTVINSTRDLYWIYFPQIRKYLAGEKLKGNAIPEGITNCDDLFFFRCFASSIYKESNVYDRKISDYKFGDDIAKEAERIEINIIELEHDLWQSLIK
jgi:gliding motility associated protien GldN